MDEKTDKDAWPDGNDFMESISRGCDCFRGFVQSRHERKTNLKKTKQKQS